MLLIETCASCRDLPQQHFISMPLRTKRLIHHIKKLPICRILIPSISLTLIIRNRINSTPHIEDRNGKERDIAILAKEFPRRMADMGQPPERNAIAWLNGNSDVHDLAPRELSTKDACRRISNGRDIRARGCHALSLRNFRGQTDAERKGILSDVRERSRHSLLCLCTKPVHPRKRIGNRRHGVHTDGCGHKERSPIEDTFHKFAARRRCFCNYLHKSPQTFE